MQGTLLQEAALWASIVVAASLVVTVLFGNWTYRRNADIQIRLLALGALQHYIDLAIQYPELASRSSDQPIDVPYGWFATQALITAQTLWILVGDRADWQRSINAILREHRSYLRSGALVCEDFSPEFVSYLRQKVADLRCAELPEAPGV